MATTTVTIVRTVVETDYSGEHSVTRTEKRDVAISVPEGADPLWAFDHYGHTLYGDWRIVAPPVPKIGV